LICVKEEESVIGGISKVAYKLRDPDKLNVGNVFIVFGRP